MNYKRFPFGAICADQNHKEGLLMTCDLSMAHQSISYQRHNHRSEVWYVLKGHGKIWRNVNTEHPWIYEERTLNKDQVHLVPKGYWHKLWNPTDEDLVIIEIQYGDRTSEDDIERILDESQLEEMRKNYHGFDYI